MSQLPLDLDKEAIQLDGTWYTREELARRIKSMLDGGDFAIGKPSQALEQLTTVLASIRTVTFRATAEIAEALNAAASRQGVTVAAVIREALAKHLSLSALETGPKRPAMASGTSLETVGGAPASSHPAATPAFVPGPGALRSTGGEPAPSVVVDQSIVTEEASPEDAAGAVNLTAKKKEEEAVERRWFGG
ncbi:MAG: CopG family transcriptional regulator [Myxococcota bacterium]